MPIGRECHSFMRKEMRMIVIYPIGSMYAIYANIWGIWMVNVTIYI